MTHYRSKQVAWWGFALAALMAAGGIVLAARELAVGLGLVAVALLVANFGLLTVRVDEREVRWSFGALPGRRIPLERIADVQTERSPWYWGWGIRWTPRGWLWRSAGLDAVWLTLTDGKRVGVGSEDPRDLERAIRARLTDTAQARR